MQPVIDTARGIQVRDGGALLRAARAALVRSLGFPTVFEHPGTPGTPRYAASSPGDGHVVVHAVAPAGMAHAGTVDGGAADWCARARERLAEMESLVAQGRGNALVQGGGCADPGGGIVPTTHTARDMAGILRRALEGCT